MQNTETFESTRRELVAVAESMLAGETNLLEGVRRVCALRFTVEDPQDEVFMSIRAIDSETDHWPLGTTRATCSEEYLIRSDREIRDYLVDARDDILQACRRIVKAYS